MEGFQRFLEPPRLRTVSAERYEERHATWLELFLDLVFVVAIAQRGTAFAHEPTGPGFLRFLGLFVPIVWAWAGFTFYATRFDTDDLVYRALTLVGMFGVAALATTVPSAFEGSGNGFALAYAGLLTIIVLGEAVIAVVIGTVDVSWTVLSATSALAGFLAAASIWWIYFEYLDSSVVGQSVSRGMTFVYAHFLIPGGIAATGVGVRLAILSAAPGGRYEHVGWIVAAGTAICMAGLGAIQLVTPPAVLDADVVLRFAAAAGACVLVALTNALSPILVLWLVAALLFAQVVFELAAHEEHTAAPLAE